MSLRKVNLISDEYYHIYNRGNSKQKIFHDNEDYFHFMGLLFACNSINNFRAGILSKGESPYDFGRGKQIASIGSYCIMSNHFHILITQKEENGISKFMQKLTTAYAMYYNKKYKRTGGLFEGKFKSEHAKDDRHLKYLFSYIHLNPIKLIQKDWKEVGIKNKKETLEYLQNYKYSSYLDYLGIKRIQNKILDIKSFPEYFSDSKSFQREIFEWLSFND
ncbi:MAG: transposase [Candidatus Nomurabacteria bacterium]|nr:transposase [Candidatus Nomurabacteria bacterium]